MNHDNKMKKIIFLDRDGTLNKDPGYLNDYKRLEYLPLVFEGLRALAKIGFEFIIVTNQSGIDRRLISPIQLKKIHKRLVSDFKKEDINILKIYSCPHRPESNHDWRKPNPGMINQACVDFKINKNQSWMVGDKLSDVECGLNAGIKSILISDEKLNEKELIINNIGTENQSPKKRTYFVKKDLADIFNFIKDLGC